MVDGKPVLLKDLYPKFAEQEVPRAIRIPLQDPISPELEETLQLIAEHPDVYLNTGHVSGAEAVRLVELGQRYGIKKILVAHIARRRMTMDQMQECASRGAYLEAAFAECAYPSGVARTHYYAEREYTSNIRGDFGKSYGLREMGEEIRAIGVENYVLVTDYGVRAAAPPVEGMRQFIASLLDMEIYT